jgi:hypothetical protein
MLFKILKLFAKVDAAKAVIEHSSRLKLGGREACGFVDNASASPTGPTTTKEADN